MKVGLDRGGTEPCVAACKGRNRYQSSGKATGVTAWSLTLLQGTTKKPDYGDSRVQIMRCRGFSSAHKKAACAACAGDRV